MMVLLWHTCYYLFWYSGFNQRAETDFNQNNSIGLILPVKINWNTQSSLHPTDFRKVFGFLEQTVLPAIRRALRP